MARAHASGAASRTRRQLSSSTISGSAFGDGVVIAGMPKAHAANSVVRLREAPSANGNSISRDSRQEPLQLGVADREAAR